MRFLLARHGCCGCYCRVDRRCSKTARGVEEGGLRDAHFQNELQASTLKSNDSCYSWFRIPFRSFLPLSLWGTSERCSYSMTYWRGIWLVTEIIEEYYIPNRSAMNLFFAKRLVVHLSLEVIYLLASFSSLVVIPVKASVFYSEKKTSDQKKSRSSVSFSFF